MNIKSVFIKNVGWVISELEETMSGLLMLTNPCIISGDGFIPMLHLVKEDTMTISKDDIVGNVFEPTQDYIDEYSHQFSKVIISENRIILN